MSRKKEQGVALIVALVLLLVITLLGVAGVQNVTLEEKMAGATWDRQVAFQVAEAELRNLEGSVSSFSFPKSGCDKDKKGLCASPCGMTNTGETVELCEFAPGVTDCSVCYRDNTFTFWSLPSLVTPPSNEAFPSNAAFCRRYLIEKIEPNYRITVAVWRNSDGSSCPPNTNSVTQSGSLVVLQSLVQ